MRVDIGGCRLFFDVEGAKLRPDGPRMREVPTVILLHGGPGADHSIFKPAYSQLVDIAQVVYFDHRGDGRSDGRDDSARWRLSQWGDDVKGLCDALEIGVKIALGTDSGVCRHGINAREMGLLVNAGMSPIAALKSATSVNAELLGLSGKIGALEAGKSADIVAVPGNPAEDIRLTEKVVFVMKDGKVVRNELIQSAG